MLEPDLIKLDRRHVTGAGQDAGKRRRLGRMTRALGTLGTGIVAMGVETEEDLAVLGDLNIPLGQGYLWGHPQSPSSWNSSQAEA